MKRMSCVVQAVTAREMQRFDRQAIEQYGMPSLALMENAGRAVAEVATSISRRQKNPSVCVLCGCGNNGGDGFVAARHLINAGVAVTVCCIGSPAALKGDAATYYSIFKNIQYPVSVCSRLTPTLSRAIARATLIIDALFGVGLNRQLAEPFLSVIAAVNASRAEVIAVDVPSGLDATTGKMWGACITATTTVTFHRPKKGFYRNCGARQTGKIVVADIGMPQKTKTQRHKTQRHQKKEARSEKEE